MQTSYLGVLLLAGSVSGCVVIEDRTPAPRRGAVSQPLRAFVEQSGVTLRSVSAEVDGHLLPLALDPVTGLYAGTYAPVSLADRCKPSYSVRYQTVFQNAGGVEVTQYEPALGHYQREATGFLPRICRPPVQPLTIIVQSTSDAELVPGATACVSDLASGECTLRAAISLANGTPGHDVVVLASGSTYTLSIGTSSETSSPFHMSIRDDLTLRASGSTPATITESESAAYGRALFDVNAASAVALQLQGLTITGFEPFTALVPGVITNSNGSLIIDHCTFSSNEAYLWGGAIQNRGYLSIDHSTLTDNLAWDSGGAVAQFANAAGTSGLPYARIRNSTISYNRVHDGGTGAGIYGSAGTLVVENVTLAGNLPHIPGNRIQGGALYVAGSLSALVRQSTLAQNSADVGAGIYVAGGTLALANSIVVNGVREPYSDVMGVDGAVAYGFGRNLLGRCSSTTPGLTCPIADSTLISSASPGLSALALNAPGTTETYALTASSPARGQGSAVAANAADITTCLHTDQRGVNRSLPCDLGAYQY